MKAIKIILTSVLFLTYLYGTEFYGISNRFTVDSTVDGEYGSFETFEGISDQFIVDSTVDGDCGGFETFFGISSAFTVNSTQDFHFEPLFSGVSNQITIDSIEPVVEMLSPNGGEIFFTTEPALVTWSAQDVNLSAAPITIALSVSEPPSFSTLLQNQSNSGSFPVQFPPINTDYARIQVSAVDMFGNVGHDESDCIFSISGNSSGYAQIFGLISDIETGLPVSNALIQVSPSVPGGSSISDDQGGYQMQIPQGYGYRLEVVAGNYLTEIVNDIDVTEPASTEINIQMQPALYYDEYRIIPVTLAPNPPVISVPEGGYGYAWFVVEGLSDGLWLPVANVSVETTDEQGNIIQSMTNLLPFQFLTAPFHFQNAGVFAVPVHSTDIQGSMESFTVVRVNDQWVPVENQQTFLAEIIPYEYTANWGYRMYAQGGGGFTTGFVTATGFAGGGSGATFEIDLSGLSGAPEWSAFRIYRRDDLFVGVEVELGPPTLIDVDLTGSVEVTASLPYQREYEFNMDELDGLEAFMAYYLFAEPTILYAGAVLPGGQIAATFLSWVVEVLIANSAENGLGLARIADETGLDIEGNVSLGVDLGIDLVENLGLEMNPSLGAHAHLGGSIKVEETGQVEKKIYLSGGYDYSINIGPRFISENDMNSKFIYPFRLNQAMMPSNLSVNFEAVGTWQVDNWQSVKLSAGLESNSYLLNLYNLPGETQAYTAWLSIDDESVKNLLMDAAEIPSEMWNIGSTVVNVSMDNEGFREDFQQFLSTVYSEQNDDMPVQLYYGFDAEDRSELSIDLELEFPIPVFPNIVVRLGGGLEATDSRQYKLAEGYWVKGLPYLQYEMPQPPQPQETFAGVITRLWEHVTSGNLASELVEVIISQMENTWFGWFGGGSRDFDILLNERGSTLTLRSNSMPADVDSALCRYWEWGENQAGENLPVVRRQKVRNYIRNLRHIRESAAGLHYGIGGFFSLEPHQLVFNDSVLLSIVYTDSEVVDIQEGILSMFWEDTVGIWHPLTSMVDTVSNIVSAWIPEFRTYTLAPRLPQGSFGLNATPDSIVADGISTAMIHSETIINNDSTIVSDSTLFTVQVNRGTILTEDESPAVEGIQVYSIGGAIGFEVQSDLIAGPILITASSVEGFAHSTFELPLYDADIPETVLITQVIPGDGRIAVSWAESPSPDVAGYHIWFDTDTSGVPYDGAASVWGVPSPVTVGLVNEHVLTGLTNGETYYIAVTAFDIVGNESEYSNEMIAVPDAVQMGDVNADGFVDVLDVVMMVEIIYSEQPPSEYQIWIGDLNNDGSIDVLDIVAVVYIILNE